MRNEFEIFLHLKTTFYQEELEKTWACLVHGFCTVLGPLIFLQISVSRIVCLVSRRFHSSPPFFGVKLHFHVAMINNVNDLQHKLYTI